jgi:membrane protein involved in colicin uptake
VPRGTVEIGVYEPPTAIGPTAVPGNADAALLPPRQPRLSGRAARLAGASLGACASLLLHALLITTLVWGGGHSRAPPRKPPDFAGPGRSSVEDDESAMQLVWIDAEEAAAPSLDLNTITSPLTTIKVDSALAQSNIISLPDDDAATTVPAPGESAASSALYGRYMGQIDARIERAWLRPRDPIKEGAFSCRARIEQDASGAVTEITLQHCNGNARWQVSLVQAIQTASPLPAPPDPKVFKTVLQLDFSSQPYSPESPKELYEPPPLAQSNHPVQ